MNTENSCGYRCNVYYQLEPVALLWGTTELFNNPKLQSPATYMTIIIIIIIIIINIIIIIITLILSLWTIIIVLYCIHFVLLVPTAKVSSLSRIWHCSAAFLPWKWRICSRKCRFGEFTLCRGNGESRKHNSRKCRTHCTQFIFIL